MSITVKRIVRGISYAVAPEDGDTSTCPQCCHKVTLENQKHRKKMLEMHGHKVDPYFQRKVEKWRGEHPTKCNRNAKYLVDGLPMCKPHAASYLLTLALKGKL